MPCTWWTPLVPLGTLLLVLVFLASIACSQGVRDVLLGLKENNKFSLLNLASIEGAGAVVMVGMLLVTGVLYPMYTAGNANVLREWNFRGQIEIPEEQNIPPDAEQFLYHGSWEVLGDIPRWAPAVEWSQLSDNLFEFEFEIPIAGHPKDTVSVVRYRNGAYFAGLFLNASGDFETPWRDMGSRTIQFDPVFLCPVVSDCPEPAAVGKATFMPGSGDVM